VKKGGGGGGKADLEIILEYLKKFSEKLFKC